MTGSGSEAHGGHRLILVPRPVAAVGGFRSDPGNRDVRAEVAEWPGDLIAAWVAACVVCGKVYRRCGCVIRWCCGRWQLC